MRRRLFQQQRNIRICESRVIPPGMSKLRGYMSSIATAQGVTPSRKSIFLRIYPNYVITSRKQFKPLKPNGAIFLVLYTVIAFISHTVALWLERTDVCVKWWRERCRGKKKKGTARAKRRWKRQERERKLRAVIICRLVWPLIISWRGSIDRASRKRLAYEPAGCSPSVRYRCLPLIRPSTLSCIFPSDKRRHYITFIFSPCWICSTQALKRDMYIHIYTCACMYVHIYIYE